MTGRTAIRERSLTFSYKTACISTRKLFGKVTASRQDRGDNQSETDKLGSYSGGLGEWQRELYSVHIALYEV